MSFWTWITWQILAYGIWAWICFTAIAFCLSRFLGWLGVPLGWILVAAIICILDVAWVTEATNAPDWDGTPDMDMIFMFGVLARIVLINGILLPITALSLFLRYMRPRGRLDRRHSRNAS